jgi:hypothetical protein
MNQPQPKPHSPRSARIGFVLVIALLALVPAAKAFLYDTLDPDSFIHLLAADQMSREGVGPIVDSQSYMSIREPWTPYSWLAEFGMKFLWDQGGYRAAVASHALMAAGLVCLYALACSTRTQGFLRVALATAFAAFLTIPYLSFRPVTAALVVMAVIVWLLVRDRMAGERTRAVWLVVPLVVLLINLHLYAILVPAWIFALWVGSIWEMRSSSYSPSPGTPGEGWGEGLNQTSREDPHPNPLPEYREREKKRRVIRYTILLIGSVLACLATPMLPGAIRSIAFYQAADPMVSGSEVKEYLPFYAGTAGKISAGLVLIMLACAAVQRRKLRTGEIFWLLGSIVLLMRMGRFSPVFAMAAAPIFAATLPKLSDRALSLRVTQIALAIVLGVGLFRLVSGFPRPGVSLDQWLERNGPQMPGYPTAAAAFVETRVPSRTGRLINEYTWGGYLSWRLGPRFKVLLDGRTNLFTPEFWRKVYLSGPDEQAAFLQSIDADAAILPTGGSRFEPALRQAGWREVHTDPRATVFVPATSVIPRDE